MARRSVWHDGQFIATVTPADGPGVRIITKHPVSVKVDERQPIAVEVSIGKADGSS